MIEAGAVGAVFVIKDEASPVLKRLLDEFNSLDIALEKTKLALSELKFPPGLNRSIAGMEKAITGVSTEATKLAGTVDSSFGKMDASVDTTTAAVARLRAELASAGRTAKDAAVFGGVGAPRSLRARGTGAAAEEGGGHGGGGGGSSLGFHERAGPIGVRSHDTQMVAGAVAGFTVWEALKASADLQQVQENLKAGGVSVAEIEKATKQAYDIGQRFGLTARDVLQGVNEIRNPLNKGTSANEGVEDALRHMNTLASAAVVLKAQGGKGGDDTAKELYDLVKSAEFRNAIGDKQFDKAIDAMVKSDVATGGIVTPRTFLQMSQMLKSALPGLSDDYLYKIMPELAQEFRGQQAGTAAASLYQQLISGQMRTKGLNLLDDLGLVNKDKVEYDKIGRLKSANPGFYKDADTFRSDPLKGMFDLIEAMKAHGITDESAQRDMLSNLFGNRNAAQMAQTLAFQYARLQRGAQGIENTKDIAETSADLLANNPYTQWSKFTSSLTNAGAALGTNLMPGATQALESLTATVTGLGKIFGDLGALKLPGLGWMQGQGSTSVGDGESLRKALFGSGPAPKLFSWAENNWKRGKGDINDPQMSADLMGIGTRNNPIKAGPLPVTVVGPVPDDLKAKREQFERMNPAGKIAPIAPSPNVIGKVPDDIVALRAQFGKPTASTSTTPPPPKITPMTLPAVMIGTANAQPVILSTGEQVVKANAPLPVTVVGLPPDLAAKRAQFDRLNPTGIKPAPPSTVVVPAPKAPPAYLKTNPNLAGIGAPAAKPITVNVAPPPAPIVNVAAPQVDTKVDVKVTASLDGIIAQLAAKIEKMVESSIRIPTSSAGVDGRAQHMPPDAYNF